MAVPDALTRAETVLIDRREPLPRADVAAVAELPLEVLPDLVALQVAIWPEPE